MGLFILKLLHIFLLFMILNIFFSMKIIKKFSGKKINFREADRLSRAYPKNTDF
jgi:hypothetical protein